jgi:hypothetical protein
MVNQVQGLVPQRIPNKTSQKTHPAAVPYSINFNVVASPQYIDLSSAQFKNQIGDVRTIFVDNTNNGASLSVTMAITGQVLEWPAYSQGYLQCAATQPQFYISTSGDALVGFQFFNIEIDNFIWSPSGASVIGSVLFAGSGGIDHSANAAAYPPTGYSKVITVVANASRAAIGVQNLSTDLVLAIRTNEASSATTVIALNGALGSGYQGGSWYSQTYKGSLEIWVPTANAATDIVSVYED